MFGLEEERERKEKKKKREREREKGERRKEKGEEVRVWERGRVEKTNSRWRSNPRQETSKQYFSRYWKRSLGGGFTHSGKKIREQTK